MYRLRNSCPLPKKVQVNSYSKQSIAKATNWMFQQLEGSSSPFRWVEVVNLPPQSEVLPEMQTVAQIVKKFPVFCETPRFTRASHWALP